MKVAIVIYNEINKHILCGFESYYCFEEDSDDKDLIKKWEICSEKEASKRAIYLSMLYNIEIRYVAFYKKRTHFCCKTSNSHLGIIKGNMFQDEDSITAVRREVEEEVGIKIPLSRLQYRIHIPNQPKPTSIFLLPVTMIESIDIINHVNERKKRHYGEIFDVHFRDMFYNKDKKNYITKQISTWIKTNPLPYVDKDAEPLSFESLVQLNTYTEPNYQYSHIIEPSFVWGKIRPSLIPLPISIPY